MRRQAAAEPKKGVKTVSGRTTARYILKAIDQLEKTIVTICFMIMVVIIVIGVFTRYVLNFSVSWGQDLALICFVWVTLVGAGVGAKRGQLIRIESFIPLIPDKAMPYIQLLINFCITVFLIYLFKASFILVKFNWATMIPSMQISMSVFSASILLASVLMLLHYLLRTLDDFRALIKGR